MSNEAKVFLEDILSRAEHLDRLLCAGVTKSGSLILAQAPNMDLQTLMALHTLIGREIRESMSDCPAEFGEILKNPEDLFA